MIVEPGPRAQQVAPVPSAEAVAPSRVVACIDCGDPMARRVVADVEIDACERCGIHWLDDGELATVLRRETATSLDALGPARAPTPGGAPCPVCRRGTITMRFHAAPSVRLAACPDHGQWLDRPDARRLHLRAKKEARLAAQVMTTAYQRRLEHIGALVDRGFSWLVSLKWIAVLALALRGASVHALHLLVSLAVATAAAASVLRRVASWAGPRRLRRPTPSLRRGRPAPRRRPRARPQGSDFV